MVRQGLEGLLGLPRKRVVVTGAILRRSDLRWPMPADLGTRLAGRRIQAIERRGKYLLWRCQDQVLLAHLGMTGSWRRDDGTPLGAHDHVVLELADGSRLLYRDPRRFGSLDLCTAGSEHLHPLLRDLGPEPLGPAFTAAYLRDRCHGRRTAIKQVIMDGGVVVGVGNIYAAESLFAAGIRPDRPAGRLSPARLERLVASIRAVLAKAITAGGSSIRDFRQAGGGEGYFQHSFQVYGRAGQSCPACAAPLRHLVQGGRRTDWCQRCQT